NDITRHTIGCSFRAGWQADYPLISNFLVTSFATGGSANNGDYTSEEFDNLVAAGDKAKTSAAAISYYHQAEEVLFRDLPSIPLWNNNAVGGYSTQVSQVKFGWDSTPLYYRIIKN
ncbi:MAG: ABC transporter substrate-binding protein, partial [Corynebacterium matruchotii]